jgi:hypothetical protein
LSCLFFCLLAIVLSVLLSFGHCLVCSSVFWPLSCLFFFWPLSCLFFCLLAIVLSVLLRFTDSDYPFGTFKLLLYLDVSCIFLSGDTLSSNKIPIGSCQPTFHLSLTTLSYARQLTMLTNRTTARGVNTVLKSRLIADWSVENINIDMIEKSGVGRC